MNAGFVCLKQQQELISFIFWVSHHEMVSNYQNKNEDAKEIGKESQVLIINHLQHWNKIDK